MKKAISVIAAGLLLAACTATQNTAENSPAAQSTQIPLGTNSTAARIKPTTAACSPCASKSPRVLKC